MTQPEKDLLLQDICARLPYGVKVQVNLQSDTYPPITCKVCSIECAELGSAFIGVETSPDTYNEFREFLCKPYLFPMSSMTKEQKKEFELSFDLNYASAYSQELQMAVNMIKWLNKNHFDYNGLINKGLAIDATDKNIY